MDSHSFAPSEPAAASERSAPSERSARTVHGRRGRGRLGPRLVVWLAVAVLLGTGSACESTEADAAAVRNLVNRSRVEHGLPPLRRSVQLDVKADRWAQHLRDRCVLGHSRLADGAPPGWRKLGENVGRGATIAAIHEAYLDSPGHRANILDPAYRSVGTAAVRGTCGQRRLVVTVQVFMR